MTKVSDPDGLKEVPLVIHKRNGEKETIGTAVVEIKDGEVTVKSTEVTHELLRDILKPMGDDPYFSISEHIYPPFDPMLGH